jgi:DNA-binding NtrC family response regulator
MPEHLSPELAASRRTVPPSERQLDVNEIAVRIDQPLAAAAEHVERAMVLHAMRACNGRVEEAARRLGLSRKGLYLKRVRFGMEIADSAESRTA